MEKLTVSFIATLFNEEKTIKKLLDSLLLQTQKVDEIVIVDSQSTDLTHNILKSYKKKFETKKISFKMYVKKSNRSEGRNYAINKASGNIIVATDGGCILKKDWVNQITKPFFLTEKIDVVAGFYEPVIDTLFQKALAPYTCVMKDKITDNFLPSSRSVAFRKSVWKRVGGYPENLNTCEDLVFAKKLKQQGCTFYVARKAVVYWPQRENILEAFLQFFNYAKGDGEAFYIRPNTPLLFGRYFFAFILFTLLIKNMHLFIQVSITGFLLYSLWAIRKNYRYINNVHALYLLPILQYVSDVAVLSGMTYGLILRLIKR